jgi:hypothetical protein
MMVFDTSSSMTGDGSRREAGGALDGLRPADAAGLFVRSTIGSSSPS